VSALLLCLGLLASCGKAPEPPKPAVPGAQVEGETVSFPKDSPQLATLKIVEAQPERASFVRINGRIGWDDTRTSRVGSPVAGRVVELAVLPGASVRRGDVLAVISSPEFGQTQSEARRADTDLQLAERTLARARELHEAGVVPLKELQSAEADAARARAERDRTAARERLYGTAGSIDQRFRVIAPIGGVVVDRNVMPGQEVRPEHTAQTPLFVITDPTRLWIRLDVPEILSQEVQLGEAVRITVPALPGEVFEARVDYVADYIDAQTRTVKARASVPNPDRRLKAEMYVSADVEVPPSSALRVPASAIYLLGDRYHAFVEEAPGRFVRRTLRAEESTLGNMRVTAGLKAGERVVADGALLLQQLVTQRATAPRSREAPSPRSAAGGPEATQARADADSAARAGAAPSR
jgi:cobalt-zinc-cadmium efflux system membrane fusion protein